MYVHISVDLLISFYNTNTDKYHLHLYIQYLHFYSTGYINIRMIQNCD